MVKSTLIGVNSSGYCYAHFNSLYRGCSSHGKVEQQKTCVSYETRCKNTQKFSIVTLASAKITQKKEKIRKVSLFGLLFPVP